MEKKLNKKIALLLSCVVLLVGCYFIQDTLAKYRKKIDANTNLTLASWNIKVNDESILNKTELTQEITPTFPSNEYVKENVLAPGSKGYFDIVIDPTETDVSFQYVISTMISEDSAIKDLIIDSYIINPSEENNEVIEYNPDTGITGEILHNSESTTIRIFIEWNDDESNIMDNEQDTLVASNYDQILFQVRIHFSQLKQSAN